MSVVCKIRLLSLKNHDKIRIAVLCVMWLFGCGSLTIQHKNCYLNFKKQ